MHDSLAINIRNVSKVYKLYGNKTDQLIDVLGLQRIGIKTKTEPKDFIALNDISLEVPQGHRIGIVGRNGAGKTTLLKLICGNYRPTSGEVVVNGMVQALMNVGLGFHPEFTGRENIEASLQYNGLGYDEYQKAIDEIIEFCELGEFIDQPFKSYSLGMQSRLQFACATAIKPDILIVDEVLGAGDAYFIAKSKARVEKLIHSGCTMLLVSHSMQQVLELCDEAIWLDKGKIRMQGESFRVVKAYEQFLHGPIQTALGEGEEKNNDEKPFDESLVGSAGNCEDVELIPDRSISLPKEVKLQEPSFLPHSEVVGFPAIAKEKLSMDFVAPGGVSRWESECGLKVCGFSIFTEKGKTNNLTCMRPAKIRLFLKAEYTGHFNCRYGIALDDHLGNAVVRIYSPLDVFEAEKDEIRQADIILNPVQIGPGDYTVGISVLEGMPIEQLNNAIRYDLLSRSFSVKVELPDSMAVLNASFVHSAEWIFSSMQSRNRTEG